MTTAQTSGPTPAAARRREQRAWYWYDWANSAYITSVGTVLIGPYLTSVAERDACGRVGTVDDPCTSRVDLLGLGLSAGSLVFYVVTFATLLSAVVLPIVGAVADRVESKRTLMARLAWAGALATCCMFLVAGSNWQLGAGLLMVANLCMAASLTVYDAILIDVAEPDERDHVSSRGWAVGYLGGGVLLLLNLGLVLGAGDVVGTDTAVRISLLSAGIWWGGFTIVAYRGLRDHPPADLVAADPEHRPGLVQRSFGQLWTTLKDLRRYPQTLLFLVAYLFYNDGIQTVIYSSSIYGQKQLGFSQEVLIATILLVQFVAIAGALFFGRVARSVGATRTIMGGLVVWMVIVCVGYVLPAGQVVPFLAMATGIGIVLGGTQALSRSLYSQMIPKGREAEYFSLYQAAERGTSWLGTLVFGLVHQLTGSYRPAIFALIVFFLVGFVLLTRLDPRRAIREAGNTVPAVV
ncbi:MFS transporter [Mumia sp. zg.B53]|uniref:MFS transporter n=1 Tax=unclassified Mumia TaxID=2621872 RepID=UPI001C6E5D65|nr:MULTISPECIES: MFS transporter [unclassified Mumia]MBW9205066.1 MFS transporter [Mumia sp. zg.B17]MBW9208930.1 MFS transporter [Mumia sp. zg.B21]MBW9213542.1 MFS transporter [Mumia sp. zg.B53]MDD9349532.1 MFS transporter [Mumia sp.]